MDEWRVDEWRMGVYKRGWGRQSNCRIIDEEMARETETAEPMSEYYSDEMNKERDGNRIAEKQKQSEAGKETESWREPYIIGAKFA